jgi:dCMP deaminase
MPRTPHITESAYIVKGDGIMTKRIYYMGFARHASTASKDAETQVGAVIVGPDGEIRLTGYNGPPRGVTDHPDRLRRPTKYPWVSHAEQNIIAFAAREGIRTGGCTLYVTHLPCVNCAKSIIQAGIQCVVVGDGTTTASDDEMRISRTMFFEAGVSLVHLPDKTGRQF